MEIVSFRTPGLGDQSHLLVHEGVGVLVDPQRDVDRFLRVVAERDVELRFVLETHLHNDYVSGAEQAALRTGAELVLPAAAAAAYRYTPAFHLEDLTGGRGLLVRPIHTPGHTPEHTSYLVLADGEPAALFSGGSLLVASAGRPDLLGPERARTLARLQYGSLRRLAALPPRTGLFPTHGEGSFCTSSGAGRHTSTIGAELTGNPLLALAAGGTASTAPGASAGAADGVSTGAADAADAAEAFADALLAEPMPIPAFYRHMGRANTLGVPPMPPPRVPELTATAVPAEARVVDVRPRRAQAQGALPGSVGIEPGDDFGSWAGWLLPYRTPIVLVAERDQDVTEEVVQLARIGMDEVRGVVRDLGPAATQTFTLVDLPAFLRHLALPGAQVLDVRMPAERKSARLDGAVERFLPDLVTEGVPAALDRDRPVLVACGSGRRASIAATLLAGEGHRPVVLTGAGIPDVIAAHAAHRAA
ncbi:MBL fold metallo-hydrolase [Planomonospora sphaerica]|uniref:MBL fold metallo-hydrolase n=1 Tax=Planomonospora sphaerica TaxID=161355 RepID=A0A171DC08_9ACTN|nr:MBL fold metallo-hydrolase [Planomonospora sphaerica]GAT67950.1 MBL fold metallo-hydrolase [Planomonospora sphaerica]